MPNISFCVDVSCDNKEGIQTYILLLLRTSDRCEGEDLPTINLHSFQREGDFIAGVDLSRHGSRRTNDARKGPISKQFVARGAAFPEATCSGCLSRKIPAAALPLLARSVKHSKRQCAARKYGAPRDSAGLSAAMVGTATFVYIPDAFNGGPNPFEILVTADVDEATA